MAASINPIVDALVERREHYINFANYRFLDNAQDAADVYQNVVADFLKMDQARVADLIRRFDPIEALLHQAIRNKCLSLLRFRRKEGEQQTLLNAAAPSYDSSDDRLAEARLKAMREALLFLSEKKPKQAEALQEWLSAKSPDAWSEDASSKIDGSANRSNCCYARRSMRSYLLEHYPQLF